MASQGAAHYAMMAIEGTAATIDAAHAKPAWRTLGKSLQTALRGLFNVRFQDHSKPEALRVVMMKQIAVAPPAVEKGGGNPEATNGP
jgi:hypothetical protein